MAYQPVNDGHGGRPNGAEGEGATTHTPFHVCAQGGEAFAQFGRGRRPSRRRDSWYDLALVTKAGEEILERYDTFAIRELRRLKLVWQSWGPMLELATSDWDRLSGTPNGIRRVVFNDPAMMRLFFLSLLWRASATSLAEFSEIELRASERRRLRSAVRLGRTDLPDDFFPVTLTQISTRGPPHNHGAIAQVKQPVSVGRYRNKPQPIFRFYLDGLVVHVHRDPGRTNIDGLWPMLVGPEAGTILSMVTWEASWQALNMADTIADVEHQFPGQIARAEGARRAGTPSRSG